MKDVLPPASILQKIIEHDRALGDQIFARAESFRETAIPPFPFRTKLKLMFQGAASVFGASTPISMPAPISLEDAWRTTGNNLRRAMREIVNENNIQLTPRELKTLEPL